MDTILCSSLRPTAVNATCGPDQWNADIMSHELASTLGATPCGACSEKLKEAILSDTGRSTILYTTALNATIRVSKRYSPPSASTLNLFTYHSWTEHDARYGTIILYLLTCWNVQHTFSTISSAQLPNEPLGKTVSRQLGDESFGGRDLATTERNHTETPCGKNMQELDRLSTVHWKMGMQWSDRSCTTLPEAIRFFTDQTTCIANNRKTSK